MILVLLGSQENSFRRLLEQVEKCVENNIIRDKVVVQAGHTKFFSNEMEIFNFTSNENLNELIDKADLVITHGGVGSIMSCIKKGKKVIGVARLKEFGEHVNNHQKQIVENFHNKKYIIGTSNVEDLQHILQNIDEFKPELFSSTSGNIAKLVCDYIDNH